MSNPDTFFVSDSLSSLFKDTEVVSTKTYVMIGDMKGSFVSFASEKRTLKVRIDQRHNPFELFDSPNINASIIFPDGATKDLKYTTYLFKVEQGNDGFVVTIGDKK